MTISPASLRPWSDLLPELLGHVIAHLPFPADRARLRVVCRGWHSAARHHVSQLPWLVLPDGSFVTVGDGGTYFHRRTAIPGLPEDATCVGSTDGWLALDRTDQAHRRTTIQDMYYSGAFREPSRDVKHAHAYLLHNPFSGATVPLPELDAVAGVVSEVFEVRKVLMRSPSSAPGDDVIAFMTSSTRCNIILCRPGKGTFVLPDFAVHDVEFLGDWLYGITPGEDLLAFRVAEDGDGKPTVTEFKRVIKHPLADDGEVREQDGEPYEANNYIMTTSKIVRSRGGELLMVRRQTQVPPFSSSYTLEVEVFKADLDAGEWVLSADDGLAEDEALFLSRSFCRSTHVYGDIKAGFIYFDDTDEVFDTRCRTCRPFRLPPQSHLFSSSCRLTWIFPPELVV
ncbi:uncharacterized protein C2845_PM05G32310 [Panicum miliaceum]|uniref:F-box domain-containing protein n=1 Tax=Panicum miliaceum TaxID=4540 RepID=A0A3L6SZQ7_PANMI|nr:uncharacterized protein C2845_PM05G32310 [Panicum miliaceum]